jgi:hypothetical protein
MHYYLSNIYNVYSLIERENYTSIFSLILKKKFADFLGLSGLNSVYRQSAAHTSHGLSGISGKRCPLTNQHFHVSLSLYPALPCELLHISNHHFHATFSL